MRKSIMLPFLIVAIAGCKDKPKRKFVMTSHTGRIVISVPPVDSSRIMVDNFKTYTEAWGKFQDVAREE